MKISTFSRISLVIIFICFFLFVEFQLSVAEKDFEENKDIAEDIVKKQTLIINNQKIFKNHLVNIYAGLPHWHRYSDGTAVYSPKK